MWYLLAKEYNCCASCAGAFSGGVKRFREFVTFQREYVYPEFVVAYKRVRQTTSLQPPHNGGTTRATEPEPEEEREPEEPEQKNMSRPSDVLEPESGMEPKGLAGTSSTRMQTTQMTTW